MTHAARLSAMVKDALERLPWCHQVDAIQETSAYSLDVSWRREDGSLHTFELTYGEDEKACEGKDAARAFLLLLKDKMEIDAEIRQIKQEITDDALGRVPTFTQVVVACDGEKCDRITGERFLGKPCPTCKKGTVRRMKVTVPRMPIPGVGGRREIIG